MTEESGIAKGIRRITAVTGHEAAEARRLADAFTARLNQLDNMSGPEKDAGLKSYTVVRRMPYPRGQLCSSSTQELGQADISVLRKAELRDRLASIRKAFDKEVKEREAKTNKAVSPCFSSRTLEWFQISSPRLWMLYNSTSKPTRTQRRTSLSSMFQAMQRFCRVWYSKGGNWARPSMPSARTLPTGGSPTSTSCRRRRRPRVSTRTNGQLSSPEFSVGRHVSALQLLPLVGSLTNRQAGGKGDSTQGSGPNVDKAQEALDAARDYFVKQTGFTV